MFKFDYTKSIYDCSQRIKKKYKLNSDVYVHPGWGKIVDECLKKIFSIDPGIQVDQIKEKFGGLRIYISNVSNNTFESVYSIIDQTEDDSFKSCQVCNKEGKPIKISGYIFTFCPDHIKKATEK